MFQPDVMPLFFLKLCGNEKSLGHRGNRLAGFQRPCSPRRVFTIVPHQLRRDVEQLEYLASKEASVALGGWQFPSLGSFA